MKKSIIIMASLLSIGMTEASVAREAISIVGSSTVYPFAKDVSRRFSQITALQTPKIESTGSGGGFKLFCAGVGTQHPDINNASRRMKASELDLCKQNGVSDIVEVLIGYDGVSVASSVLIDKYAFSDKDLYLGLAKWVPDENGKMIKNPHQRWSSVNPSLPDEEIRVYGPPASSGTRDAFSELALGKGAATFGFLKKLSKLKAEDQGAIQSAVQAANIPASYWEQVVEKKAAKASGKDLFKNLVYDIRDDGVYVESGENDDLVVNELVANPYSIGIIGYGFLRENQKKIHGSSINGIEPSLADISEGRYPLSRGLYFYVKKAHIGKVPGIEEYIRIFLSRVEVGKGGYLENDGLIIMDSATYSAVRRTSFGLVNLTL